MAGYVGSSEKIVDSAYLYSQFSAFDQRREQKLKDSLYTPEHYVFNDVDGALTIIDDGLASLDTEVEISVVKSKLLEEDMHSYQIGEKVDLIPETEVYLRAATLNKEDTDLDLDTLDTP